MQLLEIELKTRQLEETVKFYEEQMGLQLIEKTNDFVSFKVGSSKLKFKQTKMQSPFYHFAFDIPAHKLNQALEWTKERFEVILNDDGDEITDFKNWNAKSFYFLDNNGNILEFIARFDLKNPSENDFDADSLLCISEIGLVTDNPIQTSEKLTSMYGLSNFSKGFKSDQFSTIGDDNGLFIIVHPNRKWYPTQIPSGKFPLKVKVQNEGDIIDLNF